MFVDTTFVPHGGSCVSPKTTPSRIIRVSFSPGTSYRPCAGAPKFITLLLTGLWRRIRNRPFDRGPVCAHVVHGRSAHPRDRRAHRPRREIEPDRRVDRASITPPAHVRGHARYRVLGHRLHHRRAASQAASVTSSLARKRDLAVALGVSLARNSYSCGAQAPCRDPRALSRSVAPVGPGVVNRPVARGATGHHAPCPSRSVPVWCGTSQLAGSEPCAQGQPAL